MNRILCLRIFSETGVTGREESVESFKRVTKRVYKKLIATQNFLIKTTWDDRKPVIDSIPYVPTPYDILAEFLDEINVDR